jgi:hypothetical protein
MSRLFAMAFPIPPGKTEEWKKFIAELTGPRKADYVASRKRLGARERTFLQQTPMGDMVIVTLEGENPEKSFAEFGMGNDEFTQWFLGRVSSIHGVDLRQPPPGPLPQMVIDSAS